MANAQEQSDTGKATLPVFIWKEVEIMGNTQHSREEILAHIPLQLGEFFFVNSDNMVDEIVPFYRPALVGNGVRIASLEYSL